MALTSITKDFIVRSGLIVQATNTVTSSTSQITALQVNSGAAIAKNLIVGQGTQLYGDTQVLSTATATTAGDGALQLAGGAYIGNNLVIGATASSTGTTASNSIYTAGGVGIAQDLTVGGSVVISGNLTVAGTQTVVNSVVTAIQDPVIDLGGGLSNTALTVDDGYNKGLAIHYFDTADKVTALVRNNTSGNMSLRTDINSVASNSDLVNSGVWGTLDLGSITINDSTAATNETTGALQVAGGAGIQGALYVGATSYVLGAEILTTATIANYNVSKVISGNGIGVNTSTGEVTVTNTGVTQATSGTGIALSGTTGSITITNVGVTAANQGTGIGIDVTTGSVTITNTGVTALNAGTDTSLLSGATTGSVTLNVTSTLQSVTGRGATTDQAISITNTNGSEDPTTGALTVVGGVGIGGDVYVGASINAALTSYVNNAEIITTATIANYQGKQPVAGTGIDITTGTQTTITNIGVVSLSNTDGYIDVSSSTGTVTINSLGVNTITAGNALSINGVGTGVSSTGSVTIDNLGVTQITAGNAISIGANATSTGSVTIDNLGVTALNAGTDTALVSGLTTGSVTLNVTSTLDTVTGRGNSTANSIILTGGSASSSTSTGDLQVAGGVGVGGDINAGGNLSLGSNLSGPTTITSPDSFTITATNAGANINLWSGPGGVVNSQGAEVITTATIDNYTSKAPDAGPGISIDHTPTSTTVTNIGVTALNAGTDTSLLSGATTGSVTLNVTSTLQSVTGRGATTDQAISITNNTPSTSPTTGALTVSGGVGIVGTVYTDGNIELGGGSINDTNNNGIQLYSGFYAQLNYDNSAYVYVQNDGVWLETDGGTAQLDNDGNFIASGAISATSVSATTGSFTSVSATTGSFTDVNSTGTITANVVTATSVSATTGTFTDVSSTGTATFNNITVTGTFSATNLTLDGITIGNLTTTGTNTFTNLLTVGVPTTATVVTSLESNNMQLASYTSDVISGTGKVNLDAFDASIYRTTRYVVQAFDSGNVHISEMTVFHNGTQVFLNEYGISYNDLPLGEFNAELNGSLITLTFTPFGASNMTIKVVTMSITL